MSPLFLWLAIWVYPMFSVPDFYVMRSQFIDAYALSINEIPPVTLTLTQSEKLLRQVGTLDDLVIDKVMMSLRCAGEYNIDHNNILTIIDYSRPSNQKRLWVFDLKAKKLLYYTYVSHGITSGTLLTDYFSNRFNSKASSIGVYKTDKSYYGREGLSLKLNGLDRNFNDNASNRSIVMHGGWYVEEPFIKRYGRPGRSWGCPALPLSEYQGIINTIKENSFMVAYYPSDRWFGASKFLNCMRHKPMAHAAMQPEVKKPNDNVAEREDVLFASPIQHLKKADDNMVASMSADAYEAIFHKTPPVERMLRRRINNIEYIALSNTEFQSIAAHTSPHDRSALKAVFFVIPVIVMSHGYYETKMQIVNLGQIKDVRMNADLSKNAPVSRYTITFESNQAIELKATNRFVRWIGL